MISFRFFFFFIFQPTTGLDVGCADGGCTRVLREEQEGGALRLFVSPPFSRRCAAQHSSSSDSFRLSPLSLSLADDLSRVILYKTSNRLQNLFQSAVYACTSRAPRRRALVALLKWKEGEKMRRGGGASVFPQDCAV